MTSAFYGVFFCLFVSDGESVTSLFCLRIHQVGVGFNGIIKTSKVLSTEDAFSIMAVGELERNFVSLSLVLALAVKSINLMSSRSKYCEFCC